MRIGYLFVIGNVPHSVSLSLSLTRCPILYLPIQTLCSILSFLNSDKGWNKLILIWCQLGGITRFRLPPLFRIQSHFNALTDKEKKRDKKCALCVYRKPKYTKMNFSWHFHESIDVFWFYTSDIAIARSISMRLEVIICLHLDSFEKWDKKELEKLFLDLCIWEKLFSLLKGGKQTRTSRARSKTFLLREEGKYRERNSFEIF